MYSMIQSVRLRCFIMLIAFGLSACTAGELRLGNELEQQGDWDGAVNAYREALKKQPFNKEVEKRYRIAKNKAAENHFTRGREWLKKGELGEALQEFQFALGLDPENPEHHSALNDAWRLKNARQMLLDAKQMENHGRFDDALSLYESAVEMDPSLTPAIEGITRVVKQQQAFHSIGGSAEPITLRFQNTRLKQVFEILARTANIDILFDKDVRDDLVTIFTKDTPFDEALNLILTTNQLFAKRVGPDRLLVIPDNKQKREQYEDLQIRTFYLSNSKAKDIANLLRTILETKRVYVNEPLNTVVIRDEHEKIALAEQIILANDRTDSEVLFDLEVLEVNRTKTERLGLNFAKQAGFGVFPPGSTAFSTISQTFTYRQLTSLGEESYLFTFPGSLLMNFFKQESDAKTLASPKLRVLNNQKASVNIGDKQPILLSTTNVLPGQAATGAVPTTSTVTSIEFKDVGIKLTVEPTIHLDNAITLRLQIEVTRLGDRVILQAQPEISQFRFGTRTADTALNIRDGETVVLAGLIQEEDRRSREAVPGIDSIPILRDLLSSRETEKITTEVILVITPRIVRNVKPPQLVKQTMWSGTANQYTTKPLFAKTRENTLPLYGFTTDSESDIPAEAIVSAPIKGSGVPVKNPEPLQSGSERNAKPPQFQVLPDAESVKIGDTIQLTLRGQNLTEMERSSLVVTFDPSVIHFKEAIEGPIWNTQHVQPNLAVAATPTGGQITLQMGQTGKPVKGNGIFATLLFEGSGSGTSSIEIKNPAVLGPHAQPIPVLVQHGRVRVE